VLVVEPSAIFDGIDMDARFIWLTKPYISFLGNPKQILCISDVISIDKLQILRFLKL